MREIDPSRLDRTSLYSRESNVTFHEFAALIRYGMSFSSLLDEGRGQESLVVHIYLTRIVNPGTQESMIYAPCGGSRRRRTT